MGLLQRAIETYDANTALIGVYRDGHEPLAPIGHILTSANIEITLNAQGKFLAARKVDKKEPKILIPVTEESDGRTSTGFTAHPLCDRPMYIAPDDKAPQKLQEAHEQYLHWLHDWEESKYSHPFLRAVRTYVESGTVIDDLKGCYLCKDGSDYEKKKKSIIRWRINACGEEEPACWKNKKLMALFRDYYLDRMNKASERKHALCMVSGEIDVFVKKHPQSIIPKNGKAKLISCNDPNGFVWRGRFTDKWQASTVGYIASQKAHNALRWLISEQGIQERVGTESHAKKVFLCWNPAGKTLPRPMRRMRNADAEPLQKPSDYKEQLKSTLLSFRKDHQLQDTDCAILASFDAATTGRLAVTYYNEITLKTFLERMQDWDAHCCWHMGANGIEAPDLLQIVDCAFGRQVKEHKRVKKGKKDWEEKEINKLETDEQIQRRYLQNLLNCKVNGGIFPRDILKALTQRASSPQAFDEANWRKIVHAACAALQKYRYDTKQGGNEMAWELDTKNRSFQYGRLLATMEWAEEAYYKRKYAGEKEEEARQTNAIRYIYDFRQRPFSTTERINCLLKHAYLDRIDKWQANRYNQLVGEILSILREFPENELNQPLEDLYLMGYELQRNAFFTKKDTTNHTEEE